MSSFACTDCGASFTVPQKTLDRFPGWQPRTCLRCRNREQGSGRAGARGGRRRGPREEHLPVAEVLERYHGGPTDGVFTDGSAEPNPGPGGWGAVYVVGDEVVDQAFGSEPHTTNNRMELAALLAGFDLAPEGEPTTVYTDSLLVHDTVTKWAEGWERRGWRRKSGPIANLDLVQAVYARAKARPELQVAWIPAHAGNRWNEYADALSTAYLRDEV
jgi:ribonuclease HI